MKEVDGMDVERLDCLLGAVRQVARRAGEAILAISSASVQVSAKDDGSPLTRADTASHEVIVSGLRELTGELPIMSEEGDVAASAGDWARYWCVDPLDGTKEFIKGNGEFTVNIALVEKGLPIAGVVYAPALGTLFWGGANGAFEYRADAGGVAEGKAIAVADREPPTIVASRSHGHASAGEIEKALGTGGSVSVGSSLKFCLVARGEAQVYPRLTPTCEWDTAAGQAVLEAAGGAMRDLSGARLTYGKAKDRFLNGYFVAASNARLAEGTACLVRALTSEQGAPAGGAL
jgi:3'(2'), 5'-bisphosphate nucleotidase